jgi:hypothetical protein
MEDRAIEIEYDIVDKNNVTIAKLQNEANIAWEQLHKPNSSAAQSAINHSIDLSQLPSKLEDALKILPSGQGIDPTTIAIIVAIVNSPAVATAARDIWKYVILPHIRDKFGDEAIKERKKLVK